MGRTRRIVATIGLCNLVSLWLALREGAAPRRLGSVISRRSYGHRERRGCTFRGEARRSVNRRKRSGALEEQFDMTDDEPIAEYRRFEVKTEVLLEVPWMNIETVANAWKTRPSHRRRCHAPDL
jgi:hypothetical protein